MVGRLAFHPHVSPLKFNGVMRGQLFSSCCVCRGQKIGYDHSLNVGPLTPECLIGCKHAGPNDVRAADGDRIGRAVDQFSSVRCLQLSGARMRQWQGNVSVVSAVVQLQQALKWSQCSCVCV